MRAPAYLPRQDALYLRRERDNLPMHFVMMPTVAAAVDLPTVRRHVAGRLAHLPELRRCVRLAPLGIGDPVWEEDPAFDLDRHVLAWPIPDGDDVRALAALTSRRLDTRKPLWELHVSGPLADGTARLAMAVHHALMDGGLLIGVLAALFGEEREPPEPAAPVRPPPPAAVLAAGVAERIRDRVRGPRTPPPQAGPGAVERGHGTLAGPVAPGRAVAPVAISLAQLRELRQATGATINDLYLAVVTGGLRGLLASRGTPPVDELLALVPRDVRTAADARAVGNRTWTMLVPLPVGTADPGERLRTIRAATERAKQAERSAGVAGFRYDVVLTNVALGGPHHVAGRPITGYRGAGPLQGENRLVCVALSYGADFVLTFVADAQAFPDLQVLADETRRELHTLAGLA